MKKTSVFVFFTKKKLFPLPGLPDFWSGIEKFFPRLVPFVPIKVFLRSYLASDPTEMKAHIMGVLSMP